MIFLYHVFLVFVHILFAHFSNFWQQHWPTDIEGFVVEWETRTSHFIYWFRTKLRRKLIKDKNNSAAEPLWLRSPEI